MANVIATNEGRQGAMLPVLNTDSTAPNILSFTINIGVKLAMFIVITGLDGSGTSSIAEHLHLLDKTSALLHTPSKIYTGRDLIDSEVRNVSQYAHFLYYLSANVYASDYIKQNFDIKKNNVYCVRYLIDTVVSHRVAGLDVTMDYEKYSILKPDLTLFVTVDEQLRQSRITKRGKSALDIVLDDREIRNKFLTEFKNCLDSYIEVDNTDTNIEETAYDVYNLHILPKRGGRSK